MASKIIMCKITIENTKFNKIFVKKYNSILSNRSLVVKEIINKINESGLQTEINDYELNLVLDEAITNAMEHGNNWDPKKDVNVNVCANNDYLCVNICDQGDGFSVSKIVKEKNLNENMLDLRGRGIKILSKLIEPVWSSKGSEVSLKIKLKK